MLNASYLAAPKRTLFSKKIGLLIALTALCCAPLGLFLKESPTSPQEEVIEPLLPPSSFDTLAPTATA